MSAPNWMKIPLEFLYSPSTNLLVLLHRLGNTSTRFHKPGQDVNLPQTATLALGALLPRVLPRSIQ
jgi:hypothetical protein